MLTAKQIRSLPKGHYPNHVLRSMFPRQQGPGYSSGVPVPIEKQKPGTPRKTGNSTNTFLSVIRNIFGGGKGSNRTPAKQKRQRQKT